MSKVYQGLLFIGDPLLSATKPGRRVDEHFMETVAGKLRYALDLARAEGLKPIILGGLTRKAFEVKALSVLIDVLRDSDALVLASMHDYLRGQDELNPNSTLGLLKATRVVEVAEKLGVHSRITIERQGQPETVALYCVPEWSALPHSLGFEEGLQPGEERAMIVGRIEVPAEDALGVEVGVRPHLIPGCDLVACGLTRLPQTPAVIEGTQWLVPGALARVDVEQEGIAPSVWSWRPDQALKCYEVPHRPHVLDLEGVASEHVQNAYQESEFARMLKEEAERAKAEADKGDVLEEEMQRVFQDMSVSLPSREIIMRLKEQVLHPEQAKPQDILF